MNLFRAISAWLLFLMLTFTPTDYSLGLTEEEIEQKIESYVAAEKSGDYSTMAKLLGVGEEKLKQAINDYLESLRSYFANRLNLRFKKMRFGTHRIIFVRPGKNEAFVGQEVYIYFEDAGGLRRQHEYSLFRVAFDERGNMRWQPLSSSRGDFEDVGRES